MTKDEIQELGWQELLKRAVTEPGLIHQAYSQFHNYSIGNKILALWQCALLGVQPGPLSTYKGWNEKGRQVKRGEKALLLWQPFTGSKKETDPESGEEITKVFTYFKLLPRWFVLSQTSGTEEPEFPEIAGWDLELALTNLEISMAPFEEMSGNTQGVAMPGRKIAINPLAARPAKTAAHEMAHVMMHGHEIDKAVIVDTEQLTRSLMEVEAESVAMIVIAALGLPGEEYSRGYIQGWWGLGNEIPETSARRIFSIANQILEAGKEKEAKQEWTTEDSLVS